MPQNIELLLLPPYWPELNSVEHIWDYIREQKSFNNHVFTSLDQVENQLTKALKQIHKDEDTIKNMCNFNSIRSASC